MSNAYILNRKAYIDKKENIIKKYNRSNDYLLCDVYKKYSQNKLWIYFDLVYNINNMYKGMKISSKIISHNAYVYTICFYIHDIDTYIYITPTKIIYYV